MRYALQMITPKGSFLMNNIAPRGLALGTISHGQGTVEAVAEGQLCARIAALSEPLHGVVRQ
jgi:putative effector of murein hydrolase